MKKLPIKILALLSPIIVGVASGLTITLPNSISNNFILFLNSNFFTALAGAGFGALAGAYIAGYVSRRAKQIDEIMGELRETNILLTYAFTICNQSISFKVDSVAGLKANYDSVRELYIFHYENRDLESFTGGLNLISFTFPKLPVDLLLKNISNVSLGTRAISLMCLINSRIPDLEHCINLREDFLKKHRSHFENDDISVLPLMFGLKVNNIRDETFFHAISGISGYTDDVIFYSLVLSEDLIRHAESLVERNKAILPKDISKIINRCDFSPSYKNGLLPDIEKYKLWLSIFPGEPMPHTYSKGRNGQ